MFNTPAKKQQKPADRALPEQPTTNTRSQQQGHSTSTGAAAPTASSPTTQHRHSLNQHSSAFSFSSLSPHLDTPTQKDPPLFFSTPQHLRDNVAYQSIKNTPDLFAMKILESFNQAQKKVSFETPSYFNNLMSQTPRSDDKQKPGIHLAQISQKSYNELGTYALQCFERIFTIYTEPHYQSNLRLMKLAIKTDLMGFKINNNISEETKQDLKANEKFASVCPGVTLIHADFDDLTENNKSPSQYCYEQVRDNPSLYGQKIQIKVTGKTVSILFKWIPSHLTNYFFSKLITTQAPALESKGNKVMWANKVSQLTNSASLSGHATPAHNHLSSLIEKKQQHNPASKAIMHHRQHRHNLKIIRQAQLAFLSKQYNIFLVSNPPPLTGLRNELLAASVYQFLSISDLICLSHTCSTLQGIQVTSSIIHRVPFKEHSPLPPASFIFLQQCNHQERLKSTLSLSHYHHSLHRFKMDIQHRVASSACRGTLFRTMTQKNPALFESQNLLSHSTHAFNESESDCDSRSAFKKLLSRNPSC